VIDSSSTSEKEWISKRIKAVQKVYSAYNALVENGIEVQDEDTSIQLFCPFHDNKQTPAARYYASSGLESSHFYCFKCRIRLDGIGLYSRFKNVKYTSALAALEKRFGIHIPRVDLSSPIEITEKGNGYKSSAWSDMPRILDLIEKKLTKVRSKATLFEYTKFCRLIDDVTWDFNKSGVANQDMFNALQKCMNLMDNVMTREEFDGSL